MARNGSGTYTLPAKNPVVTGTTIESDWANTTLADIAAALTDSLSRNGNGGMLVPLQMLDGAVDAPGITFTNEPTSGLYRAAAGDVRLSILGADALTATAAGLVAAGTFEAEGGIVGLTKPELPAVDQQISASSSSFATSSGTPVDVTNLTVTITTTGRPVVVGVQNAPGGLNLAGEMYLDLASPSSAGLESGHLHVLRGATRTIQAVVHAMEGLDKTYARLPAPFVDVVVAGTYTYKAQAWIDNGSGSDVMSVLAAKLYAYEL